MCECERARGPRTVCLCARVRARRAVHFFFYRARPMPTTSVTTATSEFVCARVPSPFSVRRHCRSWPSCLFVRAPCVTVCVRVSVFVCVCVCVRVLLNQLPRTRFWSRRTADPIATNASRRSASTAGYNGARLVYFFLDVTAKETVPPSPSGIMARQRVR